MTTYSGPNAPELDHVFTVTADGRVIDGPDDVHAPEVYHDDDMPGGLDLNPDTGWQALDGYSGQHGYSGPVMHASETISGQLERDILEHPGVYVTTSVEDIDDPENPAGWAILVYREPARVGDRLD